MKKFIILLSLSIVLLGSLILYDYSHFNDGKVHITFCNVGQGDAILIRTPSGKNILYDGGPAKAVLSCLSNHLPFWDRTIYTIFLSHPHEDHFSGIYYVIDGYSINQFITEKLINKTLGFQTVMEKIDENNIATQYAFSGDALQIADGVVFHVVGPDKAYLQETSPKGTIGERGEFASLVLNLEYKDFNLLLTGDSQAIGLQKAYTYLQKHIDILHVPHHGSWTGLNEDILTLLQPKLAVISVGKNNYGHPSKQVLKILGDKDIKILRTDKEGDIEIVSDGEKWWVN